MNDQKNQKSDQEKEEYEQLIIESCEHLLPILTNFKTLDSAPHHTMYHLGLIVDATLKSFAEKYRVSNFFETTEKRFNLQKIEAKLFLKDINAEQTSRLKNLFNKFVIYVTQNLKWKSATELTEQLVLPKNLPVIREKQMFNLSLEKHYRLIISGLMAKLRNITNSQLIGLLTLSTIFDSNRLDAKLLMAIVNAKNDDLVWLTSNEIMLLVSVEKLNEKPVRFHSNTVIILLEKYRRQSDDGSLLNVEAKDVKRAVQHVSNDYLKAQPVALKNLNLPLQLNKIIEIAGADYFMNRPAFFHASMTGVLMQTPLAVETKFRILRGRAVKRSKPISSLDDGELIDLSSSLVKKLSSHEILLESAEFSIVVGGLSWQLGMFKNLLKSLSGLTKSKVLIKLQHILENPSPRLSLMSLWLIAWLQQLYGSTENHDVNRKAKKKLKQNSILRYFSTVYRYLLPVFDNIDVSDLEEDEWIELLQECLDNSNDTQLFKHLGRFVRFLSAQFDIPVLPLQDLEGGADFSNVNANLITPYEVYEILGRLLSTQQGRLSSRNRMQACALILGFFCGLRRKEVLGLRVMDIYGHKDRPFLFLRTHKYRSLKNAYSRRRLDLVDLIPGPYLKVLMDWHSHQASLEMNFLMSFNEHEIGDDKTIIDPVQDYCRQITGDATFVFHGLRHSFSNLYLIRILQINQPSLCKWFGTAMRQRMEETPELIAIDMFYSISQAKFFLKKYFPTENQSLPRSTLLQLAELLGHKVPDTTARSYLHLIDEIEAEYFTPVEESQKQNLIDQYWTFEKPYQASRFKKALLNSDKKIIEIELIKKLYEKVLKTTVNFSLETLTIDYPIVELDGGAATNKDQSWPSPVLVENIYPIYKQLFFYKTSIDDISAAFSLPKQDIERLRGNAIAISEIKTSKGKSRFKHPFFLRRSKALELKLNRLMKTISKYPIEIEKIQSGLSLYLHNSQAKHAHRVVLKTPDELGDYLELLKVIKLPVSQIGFRINPSNCFNKAGDELKAYWTDIFQKKLQKKVKPASIEIHYAISTRMEFGQIELEPVLVKSDQKEFLEHYQYAIYLLSLLR